MLNENNHLLLIVLPLIVFALVPLFTEIVLHIHIYLSFANICKYKKIIVTAFSADDELKLQTKLPK